ncbi:MAG: hypothetical protein D3924_20410 [Candidatus Electrothrix sp. AR4]|nr:hypothetical protein [Candidatus Electrothrix sp. AR4]
MSGFCLNKLVPVRLLKERIVLWRLSESLLDAHVQHAVERAGLHPFVYVLHDTTEFKFAGQKRREGLECLKSGSDQGLFGHFTSCVASFGESFGTLGFVRLAKKGEIQGASLSTGITIRSKQRIITMD